MSREVLAALAGVMLAAGTGCGDDFDSERASDTGGAPGAAGAGSGTAGVAGSGMAGEAGAGRAGQAGAAGVDPGSVHVVLRAATDAYPHEDGLASQTARNVSAGVRSFELIDPSGERWVLFDATPGSIEVGYDEGDVTPLTTISPEAVRPGHYVQARMVQDWSRLEVDATLHGLAGDTAGALRIFQVTSDGALVGGEPLGAGYYEHRFEAPDRQETFEGTWQIPDYTATAEAEAFVEDGAWAVYFPLSFDVAPNQSGTLEVEVNMDHAFRWKDAPTPGNTSNVYDFAPPLYEPVEQFGGNRFVLRWRE